MLAPYVDARTRAVAVADVSFLPGQRNDLDSIAALCHNHGAHLIVDGVQAVGLMNVRLHDRGISMWAASGHKGLLAPHGIGLFYCRRDLIPAMAPAYLARNGVGTGRRRRPFCGQTRRAAAGRCRSIRDRQPQLFRNPCAECRTGPHHGHRHRDDRATCSRAGRVHDGTARATKHCSAWSLGARTPFVDLRVHVPRRRLGRVPGQNGIVVSGRRGAIRVSLGLYNTADEVDQFIAVVDRRLNA